MINGGTCAAADLRLYLGAQEPFCASQMIPNKVLEGHLKRTHQSLIMPIGFHYLIMKDNYFLTDRHSNESH